jgi:2-keto-4-pentenoate hydratase/2-oxohepta-3-ene-1,7-dioic acid hydratase in catechol pathway
MRLAVVEHGAELRTALVEDASEGLEVAVLGAEAPSVDDAVREPGVIEILKGMADAATRLPLNQVSLAAPLRRFNRDILCTGWNYWDHFEESKGKREGQDPRERPERPTFFTKGPGTVVGPNSPIAFDPDLSSKWDYEAEVALVIGRRGRSIPESHALEYIAGYLVANDVSQRDLQRAHGGQWLKGKSIDRTMPLGPWLTTADEIPDPQNMRVWCDLNGARLQDASTQQMAFPIARLIAELSWGMTLHPGDVLLTGTPSGIGNAREPQVFLKERDELVTGVDGLGTLRNLVERTSLAECD